MAMPGYRTVLGPPRRPRHERTACSSLANSDIAPSSFLEIPLPWGGRHWVGGLERAWRSQIHSSRSGGANRTVILTTAGRAFGLPRHGLLIYLARSSLLTMLTSCPERLPRDERTITWKETRHGAPPLVPM